MYKTLTILFSLILILFLTPQKDFPSLAMSYQGTMHFCTQYEINSPLATTIKNGAGYIISTDTKNYKNLKKSLNLANIQGYSLSINTKDFNISSFLSSLNATLIFSEKFDDYTFYYAYTPHLSRFVTLSNINSSASKNIPLATIPHNLSNSSSSPRQKINIQIALSPTTTTIGHPLILTGA